MKKVLLIILFATFIISGCDKSNNKNEVYGEITKKSNIQIKEQAVKFNLDEDSLSNTGAKFTIINESDEDIFFNNIFSIEKKQNNEWYEIKMIKKMMAAMNVNQLAPKESISINLEWKTWYGELPSGEYRAIIKGSYDNDSDFFNLSSEFTLN